MKHLIRLLFCAVIIGIGFVIFQNLSQPVLAAQIDNTTDNNQLVITEDVKIPDFIEKDTGVVTQMCPGDTCKQDLSTGQTASVRSESPQSPDALPAQIQPAQKEISALPSYLNQFMLSWSPTRTGGCTEVWNITPTQTTNQRWLVTPNSSDGLKTTTNYYILAGMLIRSNLVNANQCPAGGLADVTGSNMAANNCGVDLAFQKVTAWQNQYDKRIYEVSNTSQIPATLIKNFIRQESQFWPGVFSANGEIGLGQMTTAGADTLLRWSPDLYKELCKVSFSESACDKGYSHLNAGERATLQGSILQVVNASCPTCNNGINDQQANFSVGVFTEALLANCRQVDQVVRDVANVKTSNLVSTYTDLWKITLYNYNAGSGCTERAVTRTWKQHPGEALTWDRVKSNLDMDCLSGIKYVDGITK